MSLALTLTLLLAAFAPAADDLLVVADQPALYPLDVCLVDGAALPRAAAQRDLMHDGRLVRVCGDDCRATLADDPAPHLLRLDEAVRAAQGPAYPLSVCLVSEHALAPDPGRGTTPVDAVHEGRLVRLCSDACARDLRAGPDVWLARLDAATRDAQVDDYPLDVCVLTGKRLPSAPVDLLVGTTLVRLCCRSCRKEVAADPVLVLEVLAAAAAKRQRADAADDDADVRRGDG